MLAGANIQYVSQNDVLTDVMRQLGILLENVHTDRLFPIKTLQQHKRVQLLIG